jgi:hypothetical protein
MEIYNPNQQLFCELENFLRYFYREIETPIAIMHHRADIDRPQILYNTEQLTRPDLYSTINNYQHKNILEIWDYSLVNIKILNSAGIYNTKYVPLKIWPEYQTKLQQYCENSSFEFDIGFCGWVYGDHRVKILNSIKQLTNISIDIIDGLYGDDRDQRLARCRMILNIHFNENYKIFEQYRCFAWLDIGKVVLSENSLDNDPRCINVSYDEIVPTLMKVLNK